MKTMRMMGRPTMTHKLVDPDMLFVECEEGEELVWYHLVGAGLEILVGAIDGRVQDSWKREMRKYFKGCV